MFKYKVCVYAICKNESKFVDKWMDSMSEADLVVVMDTGSDDDTVDKLRKRGALVYVDKIDPWRFDVARNKSLDYVPHDIDICVCTDLDEVFEKGWRKNLELAWKTHKQINKGKISKTGKYLYNWSLKEDGTPDIQFNYFKVHERIGFRWKCPVHEYIEYKGTLPLETVYIKGMVLNHYPDSTKSRGNYINLLEMAVKEDPKDDRMKYYLGREYMYLNKWQDCIQTLKEYLEMPNATWNEERCAAMRWIAKSSFESKNIEEAYVWYYKAIAEAPYMRDPYIEFARMCYTLHDWRMCLFLAEEALKIKEKTFTYVNIGCAWDFTPNDLCAIAAFHLKLLERSLKHAKEALSYDINDARLQQNVKIIEKALIK